MTAATTALSRVDATLRALIHGGRIGGVTQVSFVDRRVPPTGTPASASVPYAQLRDGAGAHFDALCAILGAAPVSVVARVTRAAWSPYAHGSTTEAIIEMGDGARIQYHGSLTSNRVERAVWIDGASGVLWADLSRVWWRKRGWPVFVPILGRRTAAGAAQADGGRAWGPLLIDAAIESDRTGRLVRLEANPANDSPARSSSAREGAR
jgi:predicted dehydrogenase